MHLPTLVILVYGVIVLAGGLMGYLKAGSKTSLTSGVASAALLAGAFWWCQTNCVQGLWMAAGIAGLLSVVFLIRFVKTRKFMPAGTMLLVSVAAAGYFALTALNG